MEAFTTANGTVIYGRTLEAAKEKARNLGLLDDAPPAEHAAAGDHPSAHDAGPPMETAEDSYVRRAAAFQGPRRSQSPDAQASSAAPADTQRAWSTDEIYSFRAGVFNGDKKAA